MTSLQMYITADEFSAVLSKVSVDLQLPLECVEENKYCLMTGSEVIARCIFGGHAGNFLYESVIGFSREKTYAAWVKKAKKIIKSFLSSGVWIVNPDMKVREFYVDALYSDGAAELAKKGCELIQFAGQRNYVVIDKAASIEFSGVRRRIIEKI